MKQTYKYTDYAPLFALRQKWWGGLGRLLSSNPGQSLRVLALVGFGGQAGSMQLLQRLCKKWNHSIALFGPEEAVIIVQGVVVWRKTIKDFESCSGLLIHRFLRKARGHGVATALLATSASHFLHHTYTGVDFDGCLYTYGALDRPSEEEQEWYFIHKEYFFDRLPYFSRKEGIEKVFYMNRDDFYYEELDQIAVDQLITFGVSPKATLSVRSWKKQGTIATAELRVPNATLQLRTNRSDMYSLYTVAGVLTYLLGLGNLDERVTKDVAFPVPQSPFATLLHVQCTDLTRQGSLIQTYFSKESKVRFLIVLQKQTTPGDVFVLQQFLKEGGIVLLWQKQSKYLHTTAKVLADIVDNYEGLMIFSRMEELVLQSRLLAKEGEGVVFYEEETLLRS